MPRDLHRRLGGPPPAAVKALGPDVLSDLDGLVREAHERQAHELDQALEEGLRAVPRPVRGVIRKVVGA